MKLTEQELRRSQFSYFLGKIITVQANHSAITYSTDERSTLLHFKTYGGLCEGFDEFGVWLRDTETNAKTFYFFKDIQGFIENPALPSDHPMVQEAIQRVRQDQQAKEVVRKGKEITESLGELSITDFQKVFQEQAKEQVKP